MDSSVARRASFLVAQNLRDDPNVIRRLLELYAEHILPNKSCLRKTKRTGLFPKMQFWNDPQLFGTSCACCVSTLPEVKEQQELQLQLGDDTAATAGTICGRYYYYDDGNDISTTAEKQ